MDEKLSLRYMFSAHLIVYFYSFFLLDIDINIWYTDNQKLFELMYFQLSIIYNTL